MKIANKPYLCGMKHLYKYIYSLLLVCACCTTIFAQDMPKSALFFSKTTHDYGHIDEDGGAVVCKFEAKNMSNTAISIIDITTTCGCTTAKFSNETIPAGGDFVFEVAFDPFNRPGRFDKNIFVQTSDSPSEIRLTITGYVNPRERSIDELYPFDMGGGLRLKSNFHAFGYLEHGKELIEYIGYTNTSHRAIIAQVGYEYTSGLLHVSMPQYIAAGESGDIALRYFVENDSHCYGTIKDVMRIVVDGKESTYPLSTQVIVVDNFDNMDDISAPKLVISKNFLKFGDVNSPYGVMEQRITLTNDGASPLIIRAIESSSPAVECIVEHDATIGVGESREVVVCLYAAQIADVDTPFVARVYIITNDPVRPMQSIKVSALPR